MAQEPTIPAQGDLPDAVNVIAIASGKGGVGKTWLAVTLTHAFSRNDLRALLFDGDLGLANVDIDRVPARGVRALRSTRLPAGRAGTFRLPRWAA